MNLFLLLSQATPQVPDLLRGPESGVPLDELLRDPANMPDLTAGPPSASAILNGYLLIFIVAFLVTVLITPLIRRIAIRSEIVDWPDDDRKTHRQPVAYLGGAAVFLGLLAGILVSYFYAGIRPGLASVPPTIVIAMALIMFTGLADDIFHFDPLLKIAGQLFAAGALAYDEHIGGHVAAGLLSPIEIRLDVWFGILVDFEHLDIMPGPMALEINFVYWAGAAIVAVFVLGSCNAANLIDGLDGLLTGSTAIMAFALLIISVIVWTTYPDALIGKLPGARVVLCYALLGATLGFLPHNFRPASIFLGDAGSMLLGFSVVAIVLLLGETGQTHLVFAGLIVFGLPMVDTILAILRRKLRGLPISAPDGNHLHHMLKRTRLKTVGTVFVLYTVTAVFSLTAILMVVFVRARVVYAVVLVMTSFIVVTGVKMAQRGQQRAEMNRLKEAHSDLTSRSKGR